MFSAKKWKFILAFLLILFLVPVSAYWYLNSKVPQYNGAVRLEGQMDAVVVSFDTYGIPHIKGSNKTDVYRSLGYVVASERLFQMEMMRRVGHGQLSEVLGSEFISTDALFRSLFGPEYFQNQVRRLEETASHEILSEIEAYLSGVNQFIEQGPTPPEFAVLGIEKSSFDKNDIYAIAGYMAYSFGIGQRTDPLISFIQEKLGQEYLENLGLFHELDSNYVEGYAESEVSSLMSEKLFGMTNQEFPVPLWEGSNSWVVSGKRTLNGLPILCNDTHIAYSIPQVWYEAHLTCPGFNFYGNFLGGIPYALVGHNEKMGWGLTMLEQDDMDFYHETVDFELDTYTVDSVDHDMRTQSFSIAVKDAKDTTIHAKYTSHGPLVSHFYDDLSNDLPISLWWDYPRFDNDLLLAFHGLNNCNNIQEAELSCSQIHGPGLNVIYADIDNNIAWWACAKLQKRPPHINSKCFIDGSESANDPLGYYEFNRNPQKVNPSSNFLSSANNDPGPIDSTFISGYYKPNNRSIRINRLLESSDSWTIAAMKSVMTDVHSPIDQELSKLIGEMLHEHVDNEEYQPYLALLDWNGEHEVDDIAPTFYYRLLLNILEKAMLDELGPEKLRNYLNTHWFQRGYPLLIKNDESPWWNDISTTETESRNIIVSSAFTRTIEELNREFGSIENWNWGNNHLLTLTHPFAKESDLMATILNIGPYPIRGGFETINQASFALEKTTAYSVKVGSQMRIILDLAELDSSLSIAPSGQSGHVRSPHYADQAVLYRKGKFRPQLWNQTAIGKLDNKLTISPLESSNK